ncbi:MAG: hypothetical protein K1X61_12895 [Chitinophagales bacterium]|nr:hypothetical protein [Chitinophagales bacterium]
MKLVSKITAAGFVLSFLLNCTAPFFPVDMSQNPPYYPKIVLILQSLAVALVIFSSTLMGLKLTEEKKTLAAAGFTMYAIANGISLVIYFEIRQFTIEEYEKVYDIFTSATALIVPSCLLLAFYEDFPRWLSYLPLFSCIFYIAPLVMYYGGSREYSLMDVISFIGYMLLNIAALFWAIYIWKSAGKVSEHDKPK